MTRAEVMSIVALVVSILSFGFSVYFNSRDRARLVAQSRFIPGSDDGFAQVSITIVNAGQRPVILHMWAGEDEKGIWIGQILGEKGAGLRLAEHERHDLDLKKEDLYQQTPDGEILITDIWFEDTLGRRHKVKNAKTNISKLWRS